MGSCWPCRKLSFVIHGYNLLEIVEYTSSSCRVRLNPKIKQHLAVTINLFDSVITWLHFHCKNIRKYMWQELTVNRLNPVLNISLWEGVVVLKGQNIQRTSYNNSFSENISLWKIEKKSTKSWKTWKIKAKVNKEHIGEFWDGDLIFLQSFQG